MIPYEEGLKREKKEEISFNLPLINIRKKNFTKEPEFFNGCSGTAVSIRGYKDFKHSRKSSAANTFQRTVNFAIEEGKIFRNTTELLNA